MIEYASRIPDFAVAGRPPAFGPGFRPAARILPPARRLSVDELAAAHARLTLGRAHAAQCSVFGTQTYPELFFASTAAGTAVANTASETSLLTGMLPGQPVLPPPLFSTVPGASARSLRFKGWGLLSNTGTPTMTFKFYLATALAALSGTTIGVTAAITTASGVTNKAWGFELDLICRTPGVGSGAATLFAMGWIWSPAGFASPFEYTITPGTGDSATVTGTVDGSVTLYFAASNTWSAASASNTMTLQALQAWGWN